MSLAPACPVCRGTDLDFVTDRVRFGRTAVALACRSCTHTFLDPASFELPGDFYDGAYHQSYLTHVEPAALDPGQYFEKMLRACRPWADRFKALLEGGESVLDVGCSTGHFLTLVRDKAGSVHGHELNVREVAYCRDELGLDVSRHPLEERFAPSTFDFITLIFVLEHIKDPVAFLGELKRFLKPGGRLVALVPNVDDPLVALYDIPEYREFFYCQEHFHYFNRASLDLALNRAGYRPQTQVIQEYPLANHLNWAWTRRPSDTLAARRSTPSLPLRRDLPEGAWEGLWESLDGLYRRFLADQGLGDRLWSIATPDHENPEPTS
jgi:SAM-dependent methyltransferase